MNPQPEKPVETYESLANRLDWRLLAPTLSIEAVAEACRKAAELRIRAVVVRPCDVHLVTHTMAGTGVAVASVAGYPDGTSTTATKLYEGREMLRLGVRELEFVLNPAAMLARGFQSVETEIQQIARSCQENGARLTVVLNNRWLGQDHKIIATKICRRCEASALAVDRADEDLALFLPLLKDVLVLKQATPVTTADEALEARDAGYASVATLDPEPILAEWRERLKALSHVS